MKMTKTKCPFCHLSLKFGLDVDKKSVIDHELPLCTEVQTNSRKDFLVLAAKKILDDTTSLVTSRGGH
jgi:hypothetical protein